MAVTIIVIITLRSAFRTLKRNFRAAEIDDIKELKIDKFKDNPYEGFFSNISELSTTKTSEESIINAHKRSASADSEESELSTSSNEDHDETATTTALHNFVMTTLNHMGHFCDLPVPVAQERSDPPYIRRLEALNP